MKSLAKCLPLVVLFAMGTIAQDALLSSRPKPVPFIGCVPGRLLLNLTTPKAVSSLSLPGVTVLQAPSPSPNTDYKQQTCSATALLAVNFQKITSDELTQPFGCLKLPYCGRRMLKIQMTLSTGVRTGHMFNFGDSSTNNGYAGDSTTQTNHGELHAVYPHATQWSGCLHSSNVTVLQAFNNVLAPPASVVTVWISNEYVHIQNNVGHDYRLCHKCLWALNGQVDTIGPQNENIYLAFNRVVSGTSRFGVGICSVGISWECPNCCLSTLPIQNDRDNTERISSDE